jgi:hypothetical protein
MTDEPMTDMDKAQLRRLLDEIHEGLGMCSFTCVEAEAIYELYELAGEQQLADWFMQTHAADDDPDEGDLHEISKTDEKGWTYR